MESSVKKMFTMTTEPVWHPCKLLVLDIDGTLLNDRKEITPAVRDAVSTAVASGQPLTLPNRSSVAAGATQSIKPI
jgi:ribonucleotide monophosphatase NagD (HAD superfamily)